MTPDKKFLKQYAIELLRLAKVTSEIRNNLTTKGQEIYGEHGPWIAGGFQEHWPDEVKDTIRTHAKAFGDLLTRSYMCWMKAGATRRTWLREKDKLKVFHY
jgi:hypothetical protein